MEYGFHILGLLILFLLVMVYYTKKDSFISGGKLFRGIILVTYILACWNCYIIRLGSYLWIIYILNL